MTRLSSTFARGPALVTFITGGDGPTDAIAAVKKIAPTMDMDQIILVNLCGRGDKDIFAVAEHLGVEL